MAHKYFVCIAARAGGWGHTASGPAARRAPHQAVARVQSVNPGGKIEHLCHYTSDDPVTAGRVLAAGIARGEYLDALTVIQGSGLASRVEQRPGAPDVKLVHGDLWAAIVYDGREHGLREPPYVVYGDHRHNPGGRHGRPDVVNRDLVTPFTDGGPGIMLLDGAKQNALSLFLATSIALDCAF